MRLLLLSQMIAMVTAFLDPYECYRGACPEGSKSFFYQCMLDCDIGWVDEWLLCRKKGSLQTARKIAIC